MSPARRFLIQFTVVYVIGMAVGLAAFGPPGMSKTYREMYGDSHKIYLQIIKSEPYKRHMENPTRFPADQRLAERVQFVEAFTATGDFKAEARRRMLFELYVDIFNAVALVVLVYRFAKAPLLNFLDDKRAEIRIRIQTAEAAWDEASQELEQAEEDVSGLSDERPAIQAQSEELAKRVAEEIHQSTQSILSQIDQENAERRQVQEAWAIALVKKELVTAAMRDLEDRLKREPAEHTDAVLVDRFVRDLERAP